ncbi:uncharacterized protein EV154DRAFT_480670 [Mucor mucedo]|uniref:uncharacterized protein n=1 Tax=Mucor mucedo TaxID=29922 RepID=UPI00221ECD73|nr:uncharacterized protein EV154DRAFT_480670 [Mucor mucedo]KAI7892061.1 hypothetical protein EV154DRAFT_480670 [Mucor mucedo]
MVLNLVLKSTSPVIINCTNSLHKNFGSVHEFGKYQKRTQKLNEELSVKIGCSSTSAQEDSDSTYITGEQEEEADFVYKKIYNDVVKLYQRYKASDNLTPEERKRMCAGLSGVIDISDNSYHGRQYLFSVSQWKNISKCYAQFQQSFFQAELDSDLDSVFIVWDNIYKTLTMDHNIFHARKKFDRLSSENDVDEYTFKQLRIIGYILDTFDSKQYILNPNKPLKSTERDDESVRGVLSSDR